MHPDGHGWALASTTAAGAGPRRRRPAGATISPAGPDPGHRDLRDAHLGAEPREPAAARPVTVIRSQPAAPGGTRRRCGCPVARSRSVTWPAAVRTTTCVTAGPIEGWSAKATRIDPGSTGASKPDPDPLADRPAPAARLPHGPHVPVDRGVRAAGRSPTGRGWPRCRPPRRTRSRPLMPWYCATLRYRFQPGLGVVAGRLERPGGLGRGQRRRVGRPQLAEVPDPAPQRVRHHRGRGGQAGAVGVEQHRPARRAGPRRRG